MARKCSAQRARQEVGGFATAGKSITIQYQGRERMMDALLAQIQRDILQQGIADEQIEQIDIYIKPEEQAVFYVVNKETEGRIGF